MHWHNTERLYGYLGDIAPVEFETAWHADRQRPLQAIAQAVGAVLVTKSLTTDEIENAELDNSHPTGQTFTRTAPIRG